jgi:hypothetical protein
MVMPKPGSITAGKAIFPDAHDGAGEVAPFGSPPGEPPGKNNPKAGDYHVKPQPAKPPPLI